MLLLLLLPEAAVGLSHVVVVVVAVVGLEAPPLGLLQVGEEDAGKGTAAVAATDDVCGGHDAGGAPMTHHTSCPSCDRIPSGAVSLLLLDLIATPPSLLCRGIRSPLAPGGSSGRKVKRS